MQPAKLEYFGKELSDKDIWFRTPADIAFNMCDSEDELGNQRPQHIILEPGDGTRYEFVVAYHPNDGLYFMPLGKSYVFGIRIDLDLIASATSFKDHYWPEFDNINNLYGHTMRVYQWYLWNLAIAMIEELNSDA